MSFALRCTGRSIVAGFYILTGMVHSLIWMIEPLYIFRSGDLELGIALRTTEYLGNETEYVPWSAASRELMFVSSMLQRNPLYGHYEVSLSIGPVKQKLLA